MSPWHFPCVHFREKTTKDSFSGSPDETANPMKWVLLRRHLARRASEGSGYFRNLFPCLRFGLVFSSSFPKKRNFETRKRGTGIFMEYLWNILCKLVPRLRVGLMSPKRMPHFSLF